MNFTEEAFAKLNAELMVQNFQKADRIKELEAALDVALEAAVEIKRWVEDEVGAELPSDKIDEAIAKLKEVPREQN